MTKLTHNFVRLVAALSSVGMIACGAEDDDDTTDPSIGTTMSTTNPSTTDADTDDQSTDDPTTMTTAPMDTGDECPMGSECMDDTMCGPGETCIGCLCLGGADTGTPTECGTNVSTMNVACDDCSHMNCCPEVQGCFGDETVMMNTPCLELNNCIATSCTMATNLEELQACVDESCPEFADQLQTWLAFNQCLAMNCMAQCAG